MARWKKLVFKPSGPGWSRAFRRLFWLALLLLHAGGIRAAWDGMFTPVGEGASSGAVRLLALCLSAAFFVLKAADVGWLRFKGGWRSCVAGVLVVCVLHVNVLSRAADGELLYSPAHFGIVLFLGTLAEAEAARRSLSRLLGLVRGSWASAARAPACSLFARQRAWRVAILPQRQFFVGLLGPRPPPSN